LLSGSVLLKLLLLPLLKLLPIFLLIHLLLLLYLLRLVLLLLPLLLVLVLLLLLLLFLLLLLLLLLLLAELLPPLNRKYTEDGADTYYSRAAACFASSSSSLIPICLSRPGCSTATAAAASLPLRSILLLLLQESAFNDSLSSVNACTGVVSDVVVTGLSGR